MKMSQRMALQQVLISYFLLDVFGNVEMIISMFKRDS